MVAVRVYKDKKVPGWQRAVNIRRQMGYPDDTPVVDAKKDLDFTVTKADVVRAKPRQPDSCGYANAICRVTGAPHVLVHRFTTLVAGTDKRGKDVIYRYISSDTMRLVMSKFDITSKMDEHTITLKAPKGSYSLDRRVTYERELLRKKRSGEHKVKPRTEEYVWQSRVLRPQLMGGRAK